jgi:hypothetical protein
LSNNLAINCWACDYSSLSGEGNLARLFVKKTINAKVKIYAPGNNILKYKYISPFIGIFYCWYFFFLGKKNYYLNYLPFWNFLLFALLPPTTILGPITGGAEYDKKKINIVRRFLFPIFYKISEIFLIIRNNKNYFSTELLKKYLWTKSNNSFNYVNNFFYKKKKFKKSIDLLIYYRRHENKITNFPYEWIKKIILLGIKVHVVGDRLNLFGAKNYGYIKNYKINILQSKSRFSIASNENIFSIFTIECINNHNKIFTSIKNKNKNFKYKNCFVFVNFKKNPKLKNFT